MVASEFRRAELASFVSLVGLVDAIHMYNCISFDRLVPCFPSDLVLFSAQAIHDASISTASPSHVSHDAHLVPTNVAGKLKMIMQPYCCLHYGQVIYQTRIFFQRYCSSREKQNLCVLHIQGLLHADLQYKSTKLLCLQLMMTFT